MVLRRVVALILTVRTSEPTGGAEAEPGTAARALWRVQRYDVELDRCAVGLAATLDRMDRERMLGQAEAMSIALELGLIDAADFAITPSA
jgi:hypothetical protein